MTSRRGLITVTRLIGEGVKWRIRAHTNTPDLLAKPYLFTLPQKVQFFSGFRAHFVIHCGAYLSWFKGFTPLAILDRSMLSGPFLLVILRLIDGGYV
jgi:hypothetical protein